MSNLAKFIQERREEKQKPYLRKKKKDELSGKERLQWVPNRTVYKEEEDSWESEETSSSFSSSDEDSWSGEEVL